MGSSIISLEHFMGASKLAGRAGKPYFNTGVEQFSRNDSTCKWGCKPKFI
jgi:hypothetical protein